MPIGAAACIWFACESLKHWEFILFEIAGVFLVASKKPPMQVDPENESKKLMYASKLVR